MHILCATDFSLPALAAADIAAALAKEMKLSLQLFHCGQDWIVMGDLPVVEPGDQSVRDQLKREAERLRATGIEVTDEFRRGSASSEIIALAAEQAPQMIMLGSTGNGKADRWLIGSVAERVAESACVPTLIVRQPEPLKAWLDSTRTLHMFCGVDFTVSADTAIAAMKPFVAIGEVDVNAAHIRPVEYPSASTEQQLMRQRDVWERIRQILGDLPVKVHVGYAADKPAIEFIHKAEEQASGLIVVGSHQRHGLQRLKAPSFSHSVLANTKSNVLCVPAACGKPEMRIPSINRVLVATDFTGICTDAIRHAQSLLPSGGAIHLLHVCHEASSGVNPVISSEVYFDQSLATATEKKEAEDKMKALPPALLAAPNVAVTSEVFAHGNVATAICEAAERVGADVICMGTKGHSRTGIALLGSTVQAVLAHAHKPVFVATPP